MMMDRKSRRDIFRILELMREELEVSATLHDKAREDRLKEIDRRLARLRELHKEERHLLREHDAS